MKTHKKVGIRGIKASFHHLAAVDFFGKESEVLEYLSFRSLLRAVYDRRIDSAVMAIENSIAGSILQNYSMIDEFGLKVIGEIYLPISMSLMVKPGMKRSQIRNVQSHPMAIRQCRDFLDTMGEQVRILERDDTASSARQVSMLTSNDTAAIANDLAAREFGLEVLEQGIESDKNNFTRFLVLSRNFHVDDHNDKSSLKVTLRHEIGSLEYVLKIFRQHELNLTKIQSLPVIGQPNRYNFYIDLEWKDKLKYTRALEKIKKHCRDINVMGEYKSAYIDYLKKSKKGNEK